MLKVEIPHTRTAERKYILAVLFNEFLGFDADIIVTSRADTRISSLSGAELVVADTLFAVPDSIWLTTESLPREPLRWWHPSPPCESNESIPVIYGAHGEGLLAQDGQSLWLGLDIFASSFFMLTRYEEVVRAERDEFDRFPASAALAVRAKFIHRPVVNEYVDLLWSALNWLWPGLKRKPRTFQMLPSHDVDLPLKHGFSGPARMIAACAFDMLRGLGAAAARDRFQGWRRVRKGEVGMDPYNTFDWLMDASDRRGARSAFFFIADHTALMRDGLYAISHPWIRCLMKSIHQRGHELGLHTSYHTYLDPHQTRREFQRLRDCAGAEGILQAKWGGRQHYLRWRTPQTFRNWDDAGLDYDSTLTFAQLAGFRCGVCYEYPVFDLERRRMLKLVERPLVAMDSSVISAGYMGCGTGERAYRVFSGLKDACRRHQGDFTLLWHNSNLTTRAEKELYEAVLDH